MTPKQLHLITSNDMAELSTRLAERAMQEPLDDPLAPEVVMTQNQGMARWLSQEIARHVGVCMNWSFPFPAKALQRLLSGLQPEFKDAYAYSNERATWALFDLLAKLEERELFAALRNQCQGSESKRLAFATRLARLYDEYLIYRPDWILQWEQGLDHGDWQGELWRRLAERVFLGPRPHLHIARTALRLTQQGLPADAAAIGSWPQRLSIFGVSTLPPLYLDILNTISTQVPVFIYLLQPTDSYWGDLRSAKQQRLSSLHRKRASDGERAVSTDLGEEGNPLLPILAKQSQVFLDALIDRDPIHDDSRFRPSGTDTQLAALRDDLFHLRRREPEDREFRGSVSEKPPLFPTYDGSIQFHCCHSHRREVEALQDYLKELFHKSPYLSPSDILVLAPQIEEYAPHIEAVFAGEQIEAQRIPYSIADLPESNASSELAAFIAVLDLPRKRLSGPEVLDVLALPGIRDAFSFDDFDLATIESWIRSIGTTWGWDANHRRGFGAFPAERRTWQEFRFRLAAGIAMGSEELRLWRGCLPFQHVEAQSSQLAGRLLRFLRLLDSWIGAYRLRRTLPEWRAILRQLLSGFLSSSSEEPQRRRAIAESVEELLPDLEVAVSGAALSSHLTKALARESPRRGYMVGRVTFCSLKPMRSVPARVVCIMGLTAEAFPRSARRPSFDLIAKEKRGGDRNASDEDKQLFLEAILSAKDRLYLSYQHASMASDETRAPSSVIEELQRYLDTALRSSGTGPLKDMIFEHPRPSYHSAYFIGEPLFTYSERRAGIANRLRSGSLVSVKEPDGEVPLASDSRRPEWTLDRLIRFFTHPCRFFLRHSLGVALISDIGPLPDDDAIENDPLDNYILSEVGASLLSSGDAFDPELIAAQNLSEPGFSGKITTVQWEEIVAQSHQLLRSLAPEAIPTTREETLMLTAGTLSGQFQALCREERALWVEAGKPKAKRILKAWIQHLFASAISPDSSPVESTVFFLGAPESLARFAPEANARSLLDGLLQTANAGLQQPLPFFPEAAWEFAKALQKHPSGNRIALAEKALRGLFSARYGEWDAYAETCFPEQGIDATQFSHYATLTLQPALERFMLVKASSIARSTRSA